MNILDVFLIGIALSMDAFAITIANCTTYKNTLTKKKALLMPLAFALFQGIMPLIGFYIGSLFSEFLSSISGYLTAGIFFILSFKILFDIVKEHIDSKKDKVTEKKEQTFSIWLLLIQAVATSIDALLVGVTMAGSLTFSIYYAVLIIIGVTLIIVTIALLCGKFLGKALGKYAEWAGAIILFALAVKSLVEGIIG